MHSYLNGSSQNCSLLYLHSNEMNLMILLEKFIHDKKITAINIIVIKATNKVSGQSVHLTLIIPPSRVEEASQVAYHFP